MGCRASDIETVLPLLAGYAAAAALVEEIRGNLETESRAEIISRETHIRSKTIGSVTIFRNGSVGDWCWELRRSLNAGLPNREKLTEYKPF